jgi:hypothetical protein
MIWVLTPGGFENLIEQASVPAEAPTVPPPSVAPPENVAEIIRRYGNECSPVEPTRRSRGHWQHGHDESSAFRSPPVTSIRFGYRPTVQHRRR